MSLRLLSTNQLVQVQELGIMLHLTQIVTRILRLGATSRVVQTQATTV